MRRILAILLWSVIAAAFIGPGTVTTCASAGASHGYALLWALTFSTVGCFVLQEAAARVTIVSGRSLAQCLAAARSGRSLFALLVVGAIIVGCAAYEAGNILGAAVGADMELELSRATITVAITAAALLVLGLGTAGAVSRAMGVVVALMGIAFLVTALRLRPDPLACATGMLLPSLPEGSGLLVIALVGTTIVPYNLFLGSGLARGQRIDEVRLGLGVAVGLGGLVSMGVVVAGSALDGPFSFDGLAAALAAQLGGWAAVFFAFGLFSAGLSSAITAPLAAAVTAQGLFGREDGRWHERSWRYRAVWGGVLACGLAFGLSGVRPVPVIVLAQALNGLLLPIATAYLMLLVNDRRVMGDAVNGKLANVALAGTLIVTSVLGASNLLRALGK